MNTYRKRLSTANGFTLIELLVVIAIIGILASVIVASLNSARAKSRNTARDAQAKEIVTAFNLAYDGTSALPGSDDVWNCISTTCTGGWSIYTANASVDALFAVGIKQKPLDPQGGSRGYGGYLFIKNWTTGGTSPYDGYVFPAGAAYLDYLLEPPVLATSCASGRIYDVTANYVQCLVQLHP